MQETQVLQCAICGKPAKVFVSMVTNWSLMKVCYCAKHAAESGVLDADAYALIENNEQAQKEMLAGLFCKRCGYTQQDLQKQGKFGCPSCYDSFDPLLRGMLQQTHRLSAHTGKIPSFHVEPKEIQLRLSKLEVQMQEAIVKEQYEKAALLRDEIKTLKGQKKEN
ncbi:MAG: hypothetical protein A2Y14_05810 [Verrucomicrobia bacterium GWF2_51_19]|nr:MAG: hypothetical protein A2Y14_05810 [Verrucomicrobia bacterium GWF2_51_19]HCJ12165.1 hypothetical protein [Opitutae bacterium]